MTARNIFLFLLAALLMPAGSYAQRQVKFPPPDSRPPPPLKSPPRTQAGGEDTVCPQCGTVAIRRTGYTIVANHTRNGACAKCGASLNVTE